MDALRARDLYYKYRAAVAYVAVETAKGDQQIGTAFHVGDNIWVTARHVVENNRILEVATTRESIADYSATFRKNDGAPAGAWFSHAGIYRVAGEPMLHPDPDVDVAALRLDGPLISREDPRHWPVSTTTPRTPAVQLGGWLDDWLGDELTLEPVLIMGYPPIPFGAEPLLVAARAEVNTVLDKRHERHPYFIVSAMARGGFSGSLAITSFECALGVTTESLVMNDEPPQLGYFSVLSVEPILVCLGHHGVLPPAQGWDDELFKPPASKPEPE